MAKKKSVRKITINNQVWTWVLSMIHYPDVDEIRIYDPEKKMVRVKPGDISTAYYESYGNGCYPLLQPHMIKNYIEKNLIKL